MVSILSHKAGKERDYSIWPKFIIAVVVLQWSEWDIFHGGILPLMLHLTQASMNSADYLPNLKRIMIEIEWVSM